MKVLYLTPWYPDEHDAMAGLFVQKHADAVRAQGVDVQVIHSQGWHDTFSQWRRLKNTWGLPDVVQLNVVQKQGLLALWLKRRYNIPYIIVEHWSGYLPENGQFRHMSAFKRRLYATIVRHAAVLLCVSSRLAAAMQSCGLAHPDCRTINNVVDEFFYQQSLITHQTSNIKTLLHVSCFDERAKNVKGLLRAAKQLADKRQDWQLVLVGTGIDYDEVRAFADGLNIPGGLLLWTGELTPGQVADRMHQADAFVLSSRFETYGAVLAEAAAAGLPIIATPVGIADELGAHIVQQDDVANHPKRFAEQIEQVLFSDKKTAPAVNTTRFTPQAVGAELKNIYTQVKNSTH